MNTIQTTVDAIKARAQQERDAEHQRWKDRLHLDEHAARARQRVTDLAARASEFAAILKEHDIPSADQDAILQAHPGLQPWVDNVHKCARHLRGLTFETQSRLQTALNRHEHVGAVDEPEPASLPAPVVKVQGPSNPESHRVARSLHGEQCLDAPLDRPAIPLQSREGTLDDGPFRCRL